jgi:DNA-binding CsgD family transcriptional regulator
MKNIMFSSFHLNFLIVIVLASKVLISCDSNPEIDSANDENSTLMANFENAEKSGDTLRYLELKNRIEDKIKHGNGQLKLYYLTSKANRLRSEGKFDNSKLLLSKVVREAESSKEYFTLASAYGSLGTVSYFQNQKDSAILFWKKSIEISEEHQISEHLAPMLSNLGVVYLNMGYASTASHYFLKSKSNMDKIGIIDENYYVNQINIVNAYCMLNQYTKAKKYMYTIDPEYSHKIKYLYFSNLASIYTDLNDSVKSNKYLDSSRFLLKFNKEYVQNQFELELENALKFKSIPLLKNVISDYLNEMGEIDPSLSVKCSFNKAFKLIHGRYFNSKNEIENWEKELETDDHINSEIYYGFLAELYGEIGEYKRQVYSLLKQREKHDLIVKEKLNNQLEDYMLRNFNDQIQNENKLLNLKNESKENQIKIQRIALVVFGLILCFSIVLIIFLVRIYKHQRTIKLKEQQLSELETALMTKQLNDYKNALKALQRLSYKTSLLKKQLDDSFKTILFTNEPDQIHSEIMLARTNIKVFYQSHQTILNKNMTSKIINDKVALFATNFPELNGKELKVIELILQEFSTNEIAVMLEKSQKNIEFTRTNIRKKIKIPQETDLNNYLSETQFTVEKPG